MNHLSEDELIELYYGEAAGVVSAHVQVCRQCAAQFAELQQSLNAVRPAPLPPLSAAYGERVWQSLAPRLIPYEKKAPGWRRFVQWRAWVQWRAALVAFGCALLLAGAFVGGRYWERTTARKAAVAENAGPEAAQRVVLVVLADHLDRTERLLVALQHADSSDPIETAQLQSSARELLASNRLYRATAGRAGDPALSGALDQLEGVLAEVANDPALTEADLQRVRNEMKTEGILFEVRVLMARRPDQAGASNHAKGASI